MKRHGENEKVIIWAADIHISKAQKKTVNDGDESMIERLPENLQKQVYSLSLIPLTSVPKKLKKRLADDPSRFFFYNLSEEHELNYRNKEFDGMIICKRPERIDQYKVE